MDPIQSVNLDAGENIHFARELEHVKAQTYDKRYPDLKARSLFPVSSDAGPAAESITYYQYDMVGVARIIGSYAKNLPRADVRGRKFTSPVESLGASYGYTLQDVRAAAATGKPLEQRKANAARRAIEQQINTIALFGNADYNLPGFLTNANVPVSTVPADGTGSSTKLNTKTPDKILRDMNALANGIVEDTKGAEVPTTLLLPLDQFTYIATTRLGDGSDTTILKHFLENSPFIKEVDWVNELKGAGTAGADVMVAYKRDPDAVTLEIPQDFEQLNAQEDGLEFEVPCHARVGGVILYYPLSAAIAEGV
ncbi:hypothetical protein D3C72_718830 [compost metagenome]